jgi:hypothetical protein
VKRTGLKRRRRKPVGVIESDLWREGLGRCQVCPAEGKACRGRIQGHHVIEKKTLRRHGLDEFVWDKRNRLSVCEYRHEQHTSRYNPIPRSLVPQDALDFAREIGLDYVIERYYPA